MRVHQANKKKMGVYTNETYLPPRPPDSKLMKRMTKKNNAGEILHRVKPFPNPNSSMEDTKWLTEAQIDKMALEPSTNWLEAGSGALGKVYVEILQCDGLPNMDAATLNVRDKTDAFCCLAFEDCKYNSLQLHIYNVNIDLFLTWWYDACMHACMGLRVCVGWLLHWQSTPAN